MHQSKTTIALRQDGVQQEGRVSNEAGVINEFGVIDKARGGWEGRRHPLKDIEAALDLTNCVCGMTLHES